MRENLPSITIIVAARPDQAEIKAVNAARRLDYPADRLEIIVARGKQPSVQRNAAMKAARGEWIYFLDDDSVPPPDNLHRVASLLNNPAVKIIGGPNLCPPDAPALEKVFAVVLGSWALMSSRARYASVGHLRTTSEKELILCNMLARRDAMLELGGFNEALYPNEENALMDELQKRGGKLMYDPQFIVHRRPRHSLKAFIRMLMTYGRGRAEQFRLHPTVGSAPNFVPPLFCVYLLSLLVAWAFAFVPAVRSLAPWYTLPLGLYILGVIALTVLTVPAAGIVRSLAAMPLLAAVHVFYGLGFWRGLFTKLHQNEQRPRVEVSLETVAK